MQPRQQRLLVFVGLCAIFGAAVWMLDVGNSNPRTLLAALPATEPSKTEEEDKCATECTKANGEKFKCGKSVTVSQKGEIESSKPNPDVKAGTCRTMYTNQKGEQITVDENSKGQQVDASGNPVRYASNQGQVGSVSDTGNTGAPAPTQQSPYPGATPTAGEVVPPDSSSQLTREAFRAKYGPPMYATGEDSGRVAEAQTSGSGADAGGQLSGNTSDNTPIGSGSTPRPSPASAPQTFSPSPQLSGSPFSLGSLFSGGGSGSGGGGYAGQGGTIAYVPVSPYPVLTSPNFDTLGITSGITFPLPQPSPGDILTYLAQNTKRVKADGFTAEELEDRGVVDMVHYGS